jgi:hypothetical protein
MSEALARLAERVGNDPRFLARPLYRYQLRHGLSDTNLAGMVGMEVARLPQLLLCHVPRPACWTEDVATIAQATGADRARLAAVLLVLEGNGHA